MRISRFLRISSQNNFLVVKSSIITKITHFSYLTSEIVRIARPNTFSKGKNIAKHFAGTFSLSDIFVSIMLHLSETTSLSSIVTFEALCELVINTVGGSDTNMVHHLTLQLWRLCPNWDNDITIVSAWHTHYSRCWAFHTD